MRKGAALIPSLALLAGAAGFLIRLKEVNTEFDPATGFALRGAPAALVLIILSAAVIVLAVACGILISSRMQSRPEYARAFAPSGFFYVGVSFVLGFGWIAANVLYMLNARSAGLTVVDLVFILLSVLSAISLMVMAATAYRGGSGRETLLFSVIPSLFFCYWLIIIYKNNAANPVILSYAYQVLAIAAAALSTYFSAGFAYGKSVTGRMTFSFLIGIFFSAVVLADTVTLPVKLIFLIVLINQIMNSVVFLRNLQKKQTEDTAG